MKLSRYPLLFLSLLLLLCACTAGKVPEKTRESGGEDSTETSAAVEDNTPALNAFSIDASGSLYKTMAKHAVCTVGTESINTVKKEIFGDNLAWRGSGYGVWNPTQKTLNSKLVDAIRACGVTTLRYPGGIEGDYFHWQETLGSNRKAQIDPFSDAYPTYAEKDGASFYPDFGLDEFFLLCEAADVEPVIQLNAGNGTPEEAVTLIRYCLEKGYRVSSFAIGNEVNMKEEAVEGMKVTKTPEEYIAFAQSVYDGLGSLADSVELGVIGLVESHALNAHADWDSKVLSALGDKIDFIDCHLAYAPYFTSEKDSNEDIFRCYMAASDYIGRLIGETKDEILKYGGENAENISIQITEYGPMGTYYNGTVGSVFLAALLQEMLAEPMISSANHLPMLNHPYAANLVGYYNINGTEYFWDNICTYVFRWYAEQIGREVLNVDVDCSSFSAKKVGLIPFVSNAASAAAAVYLEPDKSAGTLFLINKSTTQNQCFDVTLPFESITVESVTELYANDPTAANTWDNPHKVMPKSYRVDSSALRSGTVSAVTKPISVLKIDFKVVK
ncbi:MAG: alpha-L-arabinofuranosidase C-terminal domain-containing protein [Eubacteriales bacterium]|nr:alpha-L-arabinofuranosidase C-terminal domain-containing protein [Eubacteriales bacterium]